MMLKLIVMRVSGLGTALCIRLWGWLITRLWNPVSSWLVRFTLKFQNAINRLRQYVQMALSFKVLLANLTTQVRSIKPVLITAKAKVIQIGLRLQTTARQTLQRVKALLKKGK
jgi:hypothetical protein